MSTSQDFMEYVTEQLRDVHGITYKRMFGEFGVYCRGKFYAVVCDNQFYVKPTEEGRALLGEPVLAPPYEGAKPYFLINELEDRELLAELTECTCAALPEPKPKKPRQPKQKKEPEEELQPCEQVKKLDYKKEYKDLYAPGKAPCEIQVPAMTFLMVDGKGNPNEEGGEFQRAVELLYALSYAIKMSPKSGRMPEGYFDYVVPPLEGLWWLEDCEGFDSAGKDKFKWTAMIRQPEFVTSRVFGEAAAAVAGKKPELDRDKARLETLEEGRCVQCMHAGSYDDEPATLKRMMEYAATKGLRADLSKTRRHHEIYLGDPRKTAVEKRKTILRVPVR